MANELTVSCSLAFSKSGVTAELKKISQKFDVSGTKYVRGVQNIGTSAEAIDIGDLGTPGFAIFVNLDDTNYVTIRMGSTGADVVKLEPGELACFRLASSTPYGIANTAACNLEYLIVED